jgi:hypothetical protein
VPGSPPRGGALLAGTGLAFLTLVSAPGFFAQFHEHYGDVEAHLPRVVDAYGIDNALVFMDAIGEGTDLHDPKNTFYATGFLRNDLGLAGPVVFARNAKERNPELIARYPGRRYYLYRFNRTTSRVRLYEITEGGATLVPIAPREPDLLEVAPEA